MGTDMRAADRTARALGFIPWDYTASAVWRSDAASTACRLWAGRGATVASSAIRRCGQSLVPGRPRATGDRADVTGPPEPGHGDLAAMTRPLRPARRERPRKYLEDIRPEAAAFPPLLIWGDIRVS